jgi:hypothetical protein
MDDAKPDTIMVAEAELWEEARDGSNTRAPQLHAAISRGVTVGVRQPDGSVIYFSEKGAFEHWLQANLR